jgi:hypothetical protein
MKIYTEFYLAYRLEKPNCNTEKKWEDNIRLDL